MVGLHIKLAERMESRFNSAYIISHLNSILGIEQTITKDRPQYTASQV